MSRSDRDTPRAILVVDDFDDSRGMIAHRLRADGYVVKEARNGEEAVEFVRRECPDLVLMDLSLPVLDGLSATCRMREIEAMCDVPVVACSAHDAATHGEVALAVGCDAYLTKPLDLSALGPLIEELLAGAARARSGSRTGARRRPSIDSKHLSPEQLLGRLDQLLLKRGDGRR